MFAALELALKLVLVSGFESTCPLFTRRKYKVVSPSTNTIRVRTCDQYSSAACFDQQVRREIKNRNESKIKPAPDGSVMLVNGFLEWNYNNLVLALGYA